MEIDCGDIPSVKFESSVGDLLLPGDNIGALVDVPATGTADSKDAKKRGVVRLGPGVTQRGGELHSMKCGLLSTDRRRGKIWLHRNQRRYVPALDDMVIGVVMERHGEEYRLDINGTDTATLHVLAFEGATKKNRPQLAVGASVYARVTRAGRLAEAEVSCVEVGSARTWAGGETLYGELKRGNVIGVSMGLARALMLGNGGVLERVGNKVAFQSAVGVNGRVWVQAANVKETMVVTQAVLKADVLEKDEWLNFVDRLFAQR